jgi:hypothetical protein
MLSGTIAFNNAYSAVPGVIGTSKTMAWYEEGIWMPKQSGGANSQITSPYGSYIRIGNCVHVFMYFVFNTIGEAGQVVEITGVPYSPKAYNSACLTVGYNGNGSATAINNWILTNAGGTRILCYAVGTATALNTNDTQIKGANYYLSGFYFV